MNEILKNKENCFKREKYLFPDLFLKIYYSIESKDILNKSIGAVLPKVKSK